MVGQVPDVSQADALEFFVRRFTALETETELLIDRVKARTMRPAEARKAVASLRDSILSANAVGDLVGLATKLEGLDEMIDQQAKELQEQKEAALADARERKETMAAEAEALASGEDWRGGAQRFRSMLETWKTLPRLDRKSDDALWHRFSSARTAYTRRRKAHFAALDQQRIGAKHIKLKLIERAKELADSTDWGATSGAFRDLMREWKAAGAAPRADEEKLWQEFRGLQQRFFDARSAAHAKEESEYAANQAKKEELLDAAEADILPIEDAAEGRAKFREFIGAYHELGKVPRNAVRRLEARVRAIEDAVTAAEQEEWSRSDPEAKRRAEETVAMFARQVAVWEEKLETATAAGKKRDIKDAENSLATYRGWLQQAEATLADFTG